MLHPEIRTIKRVEKVKVNKMKHVSVNVHTMTYKAELGKQWKTKQNKTERN